MQKYYFLIIVFKNINKICILIIKIITNREINESLFYIITQQYNKHDCNINKKSFYNYLY